MNRPRASLRRLCRLLQLLVSLAALALASGCAAPRTAPPPGTAPPPVAVPRPSEIRLVAGVERHETNLLYEMWGDRSAPAEAQPPEGIVEPEVASAAAPASCPAPGERILVVGDSLVVGLAPHLRRHARACGTPLVAHGVVGSHVTEWVQPSWLGADLARAEPTVVMVSMGGNDFRRSDPERVEAAIADFARQVRQSGARLSWISPPTMPFADAIGVRAMWREEIGERDVDWFPTEELTIERVADRVHPTRAEYAALGETLFRWLAAPRDLAPDTSTSTPRRHRGTEK